MKIEHETSLSERIIDMLKSYCEKYSMPIPKKGITVDTKLWEDLGMDSLDVTEFSMEIEQIFSIELNFSDDEFNSTIRVRDLVTNVEKYLKVK